MAEGQVNVGWKITAIIFIVIFAISVLMIIILISTNNSNSKSLSDCWKEKNDNELSCEKNLNDNYARKCEQGTTQYCLESGKQAISYDIIQQTATMCNKIDGLIAQCVQKGDVCIKCPLGTNTGCIDTDGTIVSPLN